MVREKTEAPNDREPRTMARMPMTPAPFWVSITNFGDTAVLLPLAVVILVWIGLSAWRLALLWGGLLAADIALVALTKIAYMGWGLHPPGIDFTGLSGHSALSMLVWPTIGMLLAAGRRRLWRLGLPLLGAALSSAIVVSRLAIDAHTPPEAVLGALWGGSLALVFMYACWHETGRSLPRPGPLLPLVLLVPLALSYGQVFPSTQLLADVACLLSGHAQPYTRGDLERQLQPNAKERLTPVPPPADALARGIPADHLQHSVLGSGSATLRDNLRTAEHRALLRWAIAALREQRQELEAIGS